MTLPPALKGLQHIALKVRDIETSLRFYVEVLGFKVVERHGFTEAQGYNDALNFITCTNKHHVINLVQLAPQYRPQDAPRPANSRKTLQYGLHHFAFEVEDKAAFEAWEKHLRVLGIEFVHGPLVHSPVHPEGDGSWGENRALYFCDPDGNAIEIFCDLLEMGQPIGQRSAGRNFVESNLRAPVGSIK